MPCFILYSKATLACYFRYLLTSYFCIPVPYNERDIFWGVLESFVSLHRTIQLLLLWDSFGYYLLLQCYESVSIVLQVLCLSDLILWIYLSLPLYNHKRFDLSYTWMAQWFPYFLQFKSEFYNKEFMFWATVSSWSYFCWLYRASSSLAAKNIISLILVLTIWWCLCIELSLVFLEEGICYDQCVLLSKLC